MEDKGLANGTSSKLFCLIKSYYAGTNPCVWVCGKVTSILNKFQSTIRASVIFGAV